MRYRLGWSGETQSGTWQKVDIELEQDDLERLFREHGLPDGLHLRLPTAVCFQLVQNETETLLLGKLKTLGYPQERADERTQQLAGSTSSIVAQIKQHLVPAT